MPRYHQPLLVVHTGGWTLALPLGGKAANLLGPQATLGTSEHAANFHLEAKRSIDNNKVANKKHEQRAN